MRKVLMCLGFVLMFSQMCLAISNNALNASTAITVAEQNLAEMIERGIPFLRANESLGEAKQIYEAQLALEKTKGREKYDLVFVYTEEVANIKQISFKAQDELIVFKEIFAETAKDFDLSSMENDYREILLSFDEERFEETLELISVGYDTLSEVQSSQTALKSFYAETSKSLKSFFINNWLKLLIGFVIIFVGSLVFRKAILMYLVRRKMESLKLQREALLELIKRLQRNYFDRKTISEGEYGTKLTKFEEMIRDIDRQIPLLKEEIFKIKKDKTRVKIGEVGKILIEIEKGKPARELIQSKNKVRKKLKKKSSKKRKR